MSIDYISILDSNGIPVKVLAEDLGSSTWIQAVKVCKGPDGVCEVVTQNDPLPVLTGLQIVSDFSETTFQVNTIGDNLVIPGVSGKVIYIWGFMIQNQSSSLQVIILRSNTMDLPPTIVMPPYQWFDKPPMGRSWFRTAASENFNINLLNATGVAGKVWYTQV
jgi:hypothetical protein